MQTGKTIVGCDRFMLSMANMLCDLSFFSVLKISIAIYDSI